MNEKNLLEIDAIVNLALGLPLTLFPHRVPELLGIPIPDNTFYPSILGAILAGIGLALIVERFKDRVGLTGLGIGGAIVINFCGAGVLAVQLMRGGLDLPTRGYIFLWTVAVIVLAIGAIEWVTHIRTRMISH
jgi:hypothetical protein